MNKKYYIFILLLLFPIFSHAENLSPLDGNGLLKTCKLKLKDINGEIKEPATLEGFAKYTADKATGDACYFYLVGFISGFNTALVSTGGSNDIFCLPNNFAMSQLLRIIIKYLEDNPEKLHKNSYGIVSYILFRYFPCSK